MCLSCFFEVAKPGVIVVAEPKEYGFLQFILYRLENIFLHIIVIKLEQTDQSFVSVTIQSCQDIRELSC